MRINRLSHPRNHYEASTQYGQAQYRKNSVMLPVRRTSPQPVSLGKEHLNYSPNAVRPFTP